MGCLQRRMGELGALVKVFTKAEPEVVQKAIQASTSLTGINTCADEKTFRSLYPPPKTIEDKAKVAVVRERLAVVEALRKTGKYREGLELARKLEKEAKAIRYLPVKAELLHQLGELLEKKGEYKKAETILHSASHAEGESPKWPARC